MAQNIGTLVSAAIRPNDEFDPIATAYGNEIKGGLHSYETLDEVYLIITSRREWGMLASVYNHGDNNGTYKLKYGYFNTDITDNANWVKTSIDLKSNTEWIDSVISIRTIEPSLLLEPAIGDRYLLGTTSSITPSGSQWIHISATTIVEYNINGTWDITYPTNGMTVRVDSDNNLMYKYKGTFPNGEWKPERITNVFYIEPSSSNGITYSTTTSPQFTSYTNDLIFLTKFFTPNIGSASLSINGLGYKQIKIATTSGLRDLILTDIDTTSIYSLSYNGNYFQLNKPFPSDAHNIEFYIAATETMTVGDSEQYWVYGDLTIAGTMVNYGKIIVANGAVILEGSGTLNNQGDGEVILVDLFNTPTFNTTSTIQMSSTMTVNGPSVSSTIVNNSITTDLLNTVGGVTANYVLSNDGAGSFRWILNSDNSNLFYNLGGTVSATNSTTNIYRLGNIGIGTASPSTKLHVYATQSGAFRLQDGTQGSGKVLVSDSNGVGTWTDIRSYKVYTALLTRTGATGPSAIVLENTIGTITYSYGTVGVYIIYSSGLFTLDKTVVFIQKEPNGTWGNILTASRTSINNIVINQSTSSGNNNDEWTYPVSIEIRVYN